MRYFCAIIGIFGVEKFGANRAIKAVIWGAMSGQDGPIRSDARFGDLITVTMGMLQRSGMFEPGSSMRCGFAFAEVKVVIQLMPAANILRFTWSKDDKLFEHRLRFVFRDTSIGRRKYFYCAEAEVVCLKLFLTDGQFISRQARNARGLCLSPRQAKRLAMIRKLGRLMGLDGRGPARGNKRAKLLEALEREPWMRLTAPQAASTLDKGLARAQLKLARPLRSLRREPASGTGFANDTGAEVVVSLRDWNSLLVQAAKKQHPRTRTLAVAIAEEFYSLSVDAMLTERMIVKGAATARMLELNEAGAYVVECHLEQPEQPFVFIRRPGSVTGQIVSLHYNVGCKRWSMICPFSGKRSRTLYLRDELFASATSNRLVHQSQRRSRCSTAKLQPKRRS